MRPLEDVRVIAIEQYGAGPFGSMQLADLGAEVIKLEDPRTGGDVGRYVPPYTDGEDSLFYETFNRNKRSLSLDVSTPAGRAVLEDLVRVSDALYYNLRGDVPSKLALTYDDLKHLNPAIVCCSLSGYGNTGPRSAEPAYDYLLQGITGWMDVTGEPGGPPTKSGMSVVDYSTGLVAALSLVSAVHGARRDGVGSDCDVSLFDTAISMLTYPAVWHLNAGFEPVKTHHSAHPVLVPFGVFRAADGWMVIGCAKEKFWSRLTTVIGRPEWDEHPDFATFSDRRDHAHELLPQLETILAGRSVADWLADLRAAGVPCAPVNTVAQALADPHTAARGMLVQTDHPVYGVIRQPAAAVRVGDRPGTHQRAPRRNEDFDYVVNELLSYPMERIAALTAGGAFG